MPYAREKEKKKSQSQFFSTTFLVINSHREFSLRYAAAGTVVIQYDTLVILGIWYLGMI
jgi:hypothetical protein